MTNHVINKRTWQILIAAVAAIGLLAACGAEETPGGPEASVNEVVVSGDTTVEVGSTTTLSAVVDAEGGASTAVDWSTSDDDVATVNNDGVVSGIAEGTADVTATSRADDSVSDTVVVTVVPVGADPDPGDGDGDGPGDGGDGPGDGGDDGVSPEARDVDPAGSFTPGSAVDPDDYDYLVTETGDYDPYYLFDRSPDAPIEGTLRQVLADAESGSVIAFADDIDEIVLDGVDVYDDGNIDAHLVFREDVTLVGHGDGVTIRVQSGHDEGDDGDPFTYSSRVAYVPEGVNVTMQNVALTGGTFIFNGAGVRNEGTLTLRDVEIYENRAWNRGGGIFNLGDLTVIDSVIRDNVASTNDDEEGAVFEIRGGPGTADLSDGGYGGGIFNDGSGTVTVYNSEIIDNEAKISGAGIYDDGATVDLIDSTVEGNVADETVADVSDAEHSEYTNYGGGVYTTGSLAASDVTFADNESLGDGGGVYVESDGAASFFGPVDFDGNSATYYGGALYHKHYGDPVNLFPADPEAAADITFTGNSGERPAIADYYEHDLSMSGLLALRDGVDEKPGRYVPASDEQR